MGRLLAGEARGRARGDDAAEARPASWLGRGLLVAHVLLVETERGLVLVDTGYGTADVEPPGRLPALLRAATAPRLDPAETALARCAAWASRRATSATWS